MLNNQEIILLKNNEGEEFYFVTTNSRGKRERIKLNGYLAKRLRRIELKVGE